MYLSKCSSCTADAGTGAAQGIFGGAAADVATTETEAAVLSPELLAALANRHAFVNSEFWW